MIVRVFFGSGHGEKMKKGILDLCLSVYFPYTGIIEVWVLNAINFNVPGVTRSPILG